MLHNQRDLQALVTLSGSLLTNLYAEAVTVADVAQTEDVTPCAIINFRAIETA